MSTVEIFYRNVYGVMRAYPANALAEFFAKLCGAKTFTEDQVQTIKQSGMKVVVVLDPKAQGGAA